MEKKKYNKQDTGVKNGQVALFTDGVVISGDCTYIARKFGKDVLIEISLRKDGLLTNPKS